MSARAAMRLRSRGAAERGQRDAFAHLMRNLSAGSRWWDAGIVPSIPYESFRKLVPLSTHGSLAPQVERMKKGEPDVLWPGTCQIYVSTSGTSTGTPRHLPVTEAMLHHFKAAYLDSLLWYVNRAGGASVFRGRHMALGGTVGLSRIRESEPFEAYLGELSAIAALNVPAWAERAYSEPGPEIANIADWQEKIAAVAGRAPGLDISLLSGIPRWVLTLVESMRARGVPALRGAWPRLECFMHGGVPLGPFHDELRAGLGAGVNFHEIYVAAEGFVAAQDAEAADGLRLMAASGVFFEFLPMSEYEEDRIEALGQKAVPLSGVRTGVDYALVMTTPAGLARFVPGDVIRFVSTEPARIVVVGRTDLRLCTFGENVSEKDVTDALVSLCRRNGWNIVNFHVAPLFNDPTLRTMRGRHEWWVELRAGTALTPTGPIMAPELDAELMRLNPDYASKRKAGTLDSPYVRLVMPGVFMHWMRYHGKWGGNSKMPRCRSDRVIADELGGALQFAKD
jgi:hypothetical protein